MLDLMLDPNSGDIALASDNDIQLTTSKAQAIRTRLRWILGEWRLGLEYGLPYHDEILVKGPDLERVKRIVAESMADVHDIEIKSLELSYDKNNRMAAMALDIAIGEESYREEVRINA